MRRLAHHSQYFLRRPSLVQELIGHSSIKKTDTVLDIGAGSGVITSALASRSQSVIAYELDPRMVKKLHENTANFSNVQVIEKDFLQAELPTGAYKVFANIPFHLSSPIVHKLTEAANPPEAIYLIVQKQFANKLLINDDRFTGLLGAQIAPRYTTRIRRTLRRTDFWPHPAVDTVLVELLLRDKPLIPATDMPTYREFVADCYSTPKLFEKAPRAAVRISPELKPSQLTTEQWVRLFTTR